MKRYLLFAGEDYYPSGGMEDFVDSFDTIDEVQSVLDRADVNDNFNHQYPLRDQLPILSSKAGTIRSLDWYQVLDTRTWTVVKEREKS